MNITFEELCRIKTSLPFSSIQRIAKELNLDEQTVRNYFGALKYKDSEDAKRLEPESSDSIVHFQDSAILERALQILREHKELQIQQQNDLIQQTARAEEPSAVPYSTLNEKKSVSNKKRYSTKKIATQLHVFEQMESLRMKLMSIPVASSLNISQLANEVNNL